MPNQVFEWVGNGDDYIFKHYDIKIRRSLPRRTTMFEIVGTEHEFRDFSKLLLYQTTPVSYEVPKRIIT